MSRKASTRESISQSGSSYGICPRETFFLHLEHRENEGDLTPYKQHRVPKSSMSELVEPKNGLLRWKMRQRSNQRNLSGKEAARKEIFLELFILPLSMLEGKDWATV